MVYDFWVLLYSLFIQLFIGWLFIYHYSAQVGSVTDLDILQTTQGLT